MTRRITKHDLDGAQVRYFNANYDLLDSHYDIFDSVGDAITRHINRGGSLRYVQITNNNTGVYAEYRVNCPCGVVLSYKRCN